MKIIKRRVVQQWLSGESRDKIAADNNISSGTVTSIVDNYEIRLDNLDFGSFRELMAEAKKQGLTPSELASHTRLYNYFRSSGANEEKIESFITRVSTADISPPKIYSMC
ncbi:MAG: helix-turn-helix domain-containing protein [Nitrososphaeraceae archaeon]